MDLNGIKISSYIPGRIRLKAAQIKGDPALAGRITELFSAIQGINHVEVNPLTGSLLVLFNPGELRSPDSTRLLGEALHILAPQINTETINSWLQQLPL
jgi:hypothetical protein